MGIPVWTVGEVLSASDVNSWFVPLAAFKTSPQSVTSSTVLVSDSALFLAVAANAVYRVELDAAYDGATAGDLKTGWTIPAGASLINTSIKGLITGAALISDDFVDSGSLTENFGALGTGVPAGLTWKGLLTTVGTAGTLQFQFAQVTSSVTATRILAGSNLIAQRVG